MPNAFGLAIQRRLMAPSLQLGQLAPMLAEATQLQRERQWNEAAHKYTAALEQTAHLLPPGDLAGLIGTLLPVQLSVPGRLMSSTC